MVGNLSNFAADHISQPAQDIGYGTAVCSAGDKSRVVVALSSYSGTNSANGVTIKYILMPSQMPEDSANNAYNSNTQFGSVIFHQTGNHASATSPATAFSSVAGSDRGGATYLMVPRGFILVAIVADANANGTIIHDLVSGECEY
jgi:hypothetical protein